MPAPSEPTWFTRPSGADLATGRLNAAYDAADRHVVAGRADDLALRDGASAWSYARLVEDVGSLAGLMRALGVRAGDPVASAAGWRAETVLLALAAARIGAVLWTADEPLEAVRRARPRLTLASAEVLAEVAAALADVPDDEQARLVLDPDEAVLDERLDIGWAVGLRAGASDPAGIDPVAGDQPLAVALDGGAEQVVLHVHAVDGSLSAHPVPSAARLGRIWSTLVAGESVTLPLT
ncbi:UNVERIFIED_CONTAM: hypothetical protein LK11_19660 [Mumia flava]|uniref:AMP-binding protein n=1 Tax=Mumia flava TaxID=1348852 RepID=UPI0005743B3D|nr:AMP-binding protein [Mumia flava]